jgi:hypothetical protein
LVAVAAHPATTTPLALLLHVPLLLRLQAWQLGQLEVEQQTPLTQLPPAHSDPLAQALPSGFVA